MQGNPSFGLVVSSFDLALSLVSKLDFVVGIGIGVGVKIGLGLVIISGLVLGCRVTEEEMRV